MEDISESESSNDMPRSLLSAQLPAKNFFESFTQRLKETMKNQKMKEAQVVSSGSDEDRLAESRRSVQTTLNAHALKAHEFYAPVQRVSSLTRELMARQTSGSMSKISREELGKRMARKCYALEGCSSMERAEATAIQFDTTGQLFALAREKCFGEAHGSLEVYNFDAALELSLLSTREKHRNSPMKWPPLVKLRSSRRVSCLLWSAWSEDELWSASASNRELHGYDLARCADAPTHVLDTGTVDSGAVLDLTCVPGAKALFAGCGRTQKLWIWDVQAGKVPARTIASPARGALHTLRVSPDGRLLLAAGVEGKLLVWDMRSTFTPLHTFDISAMISNALPTPKEKLSEAGLALNALRFHPQDATLVAFRSIRFAGLLDLSFRKVLKCNATQPSDGTSPVPRDLVFLDGELLCSADAGSSSLKLDFHADELNTQTPRVMGPVLAFDYAVQSDRLIVAKENGLVLLGN